MIMTYKDKDRQSLVASAVGSQSMEMFEVTIDAISDGPSKLTKEEVCRQSIFLGERLIRLDNDHSQVFV